MNTAPFETLTLQVAELGHLMDKVEASWRRALAERQADMIDDAWANLPDVVGAIGASVERIEVALDDLFLLRAVYVFGGRRQEVRVPVSDLLDLLMETDLS